MKDLWRSWKTETARIDPEVVSVLSVRRAICKRYIFGKLLPCILSAIKVSVQLRAMDIRSMSIHKTKLSLTLGMHLRKREGLREKAFWDRALRP